MPDIIVIGGGAAGMAAAIGAAENGKKVLLLEKNEKLGKKIYITGKGRCNCTNAASMTDYPNYYISNPKFTYSSFDAYTNDDLIDFLGYNGIKTKVERGNRVFPVSDHASDVTKAFENALKKKKVEIRLKCPVAGIMTEEDTSESKCSLKVTGVKLSDGQIINAERLIIATGGLSYPTTGSTGDGYRFAEETGHRIKSLRPALVRLVCKEDDIKDIEGLSLRNVEINAKIGKKKYNERGEMLFTGDGISGPLALTLSSYLGDALEKDGKVEGYIDLKPALDTEQLDKRLIRDFDEKKNLDIKNAMGGLLPSSLIPVFLKRIDIDNDLKVHDLDKKKRNRIRDQLKCFRFTVIKTGPFKEAIITQGGVNVKDINSSTMESKKVSGLYFAGEVIDVDGVTGGFNLQFAFSSGHLAGKSAAL